MTAPPVPVCVGVATLDRPEGLARCLRALLDGERLPAQVVVVDQGTPGAARDVVRRLADAPVPVTLVEQPRRGLSASRNAAVAHSSAPVVAVTDDDCVPAPAWVAAIARAFAAPNAPGAVTGRVLALGPEEPGTHAVSLRTSTDPAEYAAKEIPWRVGTGANFAAARVWFERLGGYDERLGVGSAGRAGEDMDMLYRLLQAGVRVRYEPDAVVYHERQSAARRQAARESYGYGVGAVCGLWLRRRDPFVASIFGAYATQQLRGIARSALAGDGLQLRGRLLSLRGLARGVAYGVRLAGGSAAPRVAA